MAEWRALVLDDIIRLQRGYDLPSGFRRPGQIPVVGAAGISGQHDEHIASGPGVVVGRAGASMGKATYVPEDFWPLNTALFVTDFRGNNPRFIYYLLTQIDFSGFNSGAAQPMLNRNYIKQIPIQMPDLSEQESIVRLLGALDDKISVNERITVTSFELAATEYAKCATDAIRQTRLGEIVALKYGKSLPYSSRTPGDVPVFGSGGISGSHTRALVSGPGVIIGRKGTVGTVYWSDQDFFPIDTTFYVERVDRSLDFEFIFFMLRSLGLGEMNSDSAIPGLSRGNVESLSVSLPTPERIASFSEKARVLLAQQDLMARANRALAELRGTLLPRLMSGELRVKDAERLVEEAV